MWRRCSSLVPRGTHIRGQMLEGRRVASVHGHPWEETVVVAIQGLHGWQRNGV